MRIAVGILYVWLALAMICRVFMGVMDIMYPDPVVHAQDTGYRVKVILASGTDKRMEAKFVTLPDDLRLICHGDPKGMFAGDYVKVELKENVFTVGKMSCTEIAWVH